MIREFGLAQLFVDAAYIREELKRLGIDPWFGPTELKRPLGNLRIDGKSLAVRRTTFYDAVDDQSVDAARHKENLDKLGHMDDTLIRLGTVLGARNRRQKTVDMRIGLDMVQAARSGLVEYVVLASGDSDFIPAVQQVQDLGPKVLVLAFENSVSQDLVRAADRFISLPTNSDRNWGIR